MKAALLCVVCACAFFSAHAHAEWARALGSQCEVDLPEGRSGTIVIWEGACEDGKASGNGQLTAPGLQVTGEFRRGRPHQVEGKTIVTGADGAREVQRISFAKGIWSTSPVVDVAGAERLPVSTLVGNWELKYNDGSCTEFQDYAPSNEVARYRGSATTKYVVALYSVESMPEWMMLVRTVISRDGHSDCAGEMTGPVFDTSTSYLRRDHDGKMSYCTNPRVDSCVAVATRAAPGAGKPERSLITSAAGSRGINTARGFGSGAAAGPSGASIAVTFDRNKGALYALYGRALRDKPDLEGKVVFELAISVTGEVTSCRVKSSELNDAELERKLVARVEQIRFGARDAPLTVEFPFDFYPAR